MISGQKGEDIYENPSIPNFSIRNFVFASRNKGSGINNWPFCAKFFEMCMKSGIKDPLPPFDPPKLNPNRIASHSKGISFLQTNQEQNLAPNLQKTTKLCPVCKLFSSPSITTINAHVDQCLSKKFSINSSNYNRRMARIERQVLINKVKPRKMKSIMEIYANAKHGTIQDLDKRNGTNWADELVPDIREKKNYKEAQEQKMFTNGPSRNYHPSEQGAVYVDSKGIKIRILCKFNDAFKKIEGADKKKRIGSKVRKFKKLKSCEKKHLLKIKETKPDAETYLENHTSKKSDPYFSKFTTDPSTNNSHFPKDTFEKYSPNLEKELEKMPLSSKTCRKNRSAPKRKRENNIHTENNQCKERAEKDGLITKLPLHSEDFGNNENSIKNEKNIEKYLTDNPEDNQILKSTVIEAKCKDSNSKFYIGPRTNSPFTSYKSIKPNLSSNLSSNLNSTVRLMGKDLSVNSTNRRDQIFLQELIGENSAMSDKSNETSLSYMMINPNYNSMQRVPNYFDIGSSQVLFHLNPDLYYSYNRFLNRSNM